MRRALPFLLMMASACNSAKAPSRADLAAARAEAPRDLAPVPPAQPTFVASDIPRIDIPGAVLMSVALVSLLLGLSQGGSWGWVSPAVLGRGPGWNAVASRRAPGTSAVAAEGEANFSSADMLTSSSR